MHAVRYSAVGVTAATGSRRLVRSHDGGGPEQGARHADGASAGTGAEAAMLARVASGDAEAYRTLVKAHLTHVLITARRILRDDAEAEDMAQEAMLRMWRNAGTLVLGDGGLRPWLRRVVTNLSLDRLRRGRLTDVVDAVPEEAEPASQSTALEADEAKRRVDAALAALPERQRVALTLFHYEGLSQIEVGDMLGISDEAVESLLARARRALKAALKDEWRQLLPDNE